MKPSAQKIMSEKELDVLSDCIDKFQSSEMKNLEQLDGFFTALHCSPIFISPNNFLKDILKDGKRASFECDTDIQVCVDMILTFYNHVLSRLNTGVFCPLLLIEDNEKEAKGNDWASGFLDGMMYAGEDWHDLLESNDKNGWLIPIFALAHENDPNPELRSYNKPVSSDLREKLLIGLAVGAKGIYDFFEPYRQLQVNDRMQATMLKIGRNDPCPCGSGKKYKLCCLAIH